MAMLINGKGKYNSLRPKDFISLFENLDQNATNMMKTIREKFIGIVYSAEKLRDNLITRNNTSIYDEIIAIIKKRLSVFYG